MRVELTSSELLPELLRELAGARCLVQQGSATACRVIPLETETEAEAALELRFFVSAWAFRRGVSATVS